MKKIPSLFARDAEGRLTESYHPLADWVTRGEGVATRKWDGTACRIKDGKLYARYDAKRGKTPPEGFEPCQDPDPITGHWPGWVPATGPEHKWIRAAFEDDDKDFPGTEGLWEDGTYEAMGPKINGNPESLPFHAASRHGASVLTDAPRDLEGLRAYFATHDIEGIVWWRVPGDDSCDKVKITAEALGVVRGGKIDTLK